MTDTSISPFERGLEAARKRVAALRATTDLPSVEPEQPTSEEQASTDD